MGQMNRRHFLGTPPLAAALLHGAGRSLASGADERTARGSAKPDGGFVDVNVYVGRWPFRRLRGDEPAELVALLRAGGAVQGWAGSLEAPFQNDLAGVNARLAQACREQGDGLLAPFGAVNPTLPDWEEDLRRCHELHRMPGIRLHPNYHGYTLDHPELARLLERAAARGLIVQLVAWMEDARQQSRLMPVPDVDLTPLPELVERLPGLRLVLLNGLRQVGNPALRRLLQSERVWFDFANLEGLAALESFVPQVPAGRIVFGSYAPMFYLESVLLKLPESAIPADQAGAILRRNAEGLLAGV